MVVPSLAIGGAIGVVLSGGYIWWEVGRFATPQVPVTFFDERKLLAAYTVGLFAGVPLSVAYLFLALSATNGALLGIATFLLALVGGAELGQSLVLRTTYWKGPAGPFYALGFRAGVGGILALTVVSTYLGGALALSGLAPTATTTVAVVALEITGALVSLSPRSPGGMPSRRPLAGLLFGAVGFFLVTLGPLAGPLTGTAASVVALLGCALLYQRLRSMLKDVPPPGSEGKPLPSEAAGTYGRTNTEKSSAPAKGTGRSP